MEMRTLTLVNSIGNTVLSYCGFPPRERRCILSRKYVSIASVDREKSENLYCMAFALKGTVLKIVKENLISTCGRGHYMMQ